MLINKRQIIWVVSNLGPLILFLVGIFTENELLINIGIFIFWSVSLVGVFVGGLLSIAVHKGENMGYYQKSITADEMVFVRNKKDDEVKQETEISFDRSAMEKIVHPSVTLTVDRLFDFTVVGIFIYFNYNWLALFYSLHITSLEYARYYAKKVLGLMDIEKDRIWRH
jgi:hypothetical protein